MFFCLRYPTCNASRIKEKIVEKADGILHEVEKSLFVNPNASEHSDKLPLNGRPNSSHVISRTSDALIDVLRGAYDGDIEKLKRSPYSCTNRENSSDSHNDTAIDRSRKIRGSVDLHSSSPRDEAYQHIADLRVMNLQADLFLQRQRTLHQSLSVELSALEMNDSEFQRVKDVKSIHTAGHF